MAKNPKRDRRQRVKRGIRSKVTGTQERPRLSVYRSNSHIYAQLVDDLSGHTLVATSSLEDKGAEGTPIEKGSRVGALLAERAKERSEEHTSELQSRGQLVCRLLLDTNTSMTET